VQAASISLNRMKKSVSVTLTVVAAVGLASCGRKRPDPCRPATFNQTACQEAIRNGGYYYNGSWVPVAYHSPFPYYYDAYRGYVSSGAAVSAAPDEAYSRPAGAPASPGVERGGFGSSGHGGEGEGVGE